MKNSISEPAENFNSKPALNFISNQTCERAKNTARGGASCFAPAPRLKRNFKFQYAVAELNFIRGRNLKFYPALAGFAARNRASAGFTARNLVALYSASHVRNLERKSALNFAVLALNLNSAQIPNCAENKALNSIKVSVINPCENSARNFKRNFILNFTKKRGFVEPHKRRKRSKFKLRKKPRRSSYATLQEKFYQDPCERSMLRQRAAELWIEKF